MVGLGVSGEEALTSRMGEGKFAKTLGVQGSCPWATPLHSDGGRIVKWREEPWRKR
jgi:hypothetical protein